MSDVRGESRWRSFLVPRYTSGASHREPDLALKGALQALPLEKQIRPCASFLPAYTFLRLQSSSVILRATCVSNNIWCHVHCKNANNGYGNEAVYNKSLFRMSITTQLTHSCGWVVGNSTWCCAAMGGKESGARFHLMPHWSLTLSWWMSRARLRVNCFRSAAYDVRMSYMICHIDVMDDRSIPPGRRLFL